MDGTGRDTTTTTFELWPGGHVVTTMDTLVVAIGGTAVHMLTATASAGAACAVPAEHATHGTRLLGLRPLAGWVELYLILLGAQCHIVHSRHSLVAALVEIDDAVD